MIAMIMTSTMVNVAIPNIMGIWSRTRSSSLDIHWLSFNHDGRNVIKWLVSNYVWATKYIYSFLNFFFYAGVLGQYVSSFEAAVLARFAQGCVPE